MNTRPKCVWVINMLDKCINIYSTKHDGQNFSSLLNFKFHTDTHRVCYVDFSDRALQIKHRRNSNNKPFLTICSVLTAFLPAFQRKKKTQFSKLYLCNCPEKMGKMGFVLSVFRLFVFGQAKNLQGIPLCQLKYGEGTTHTAPEDSTERI